MTNGLTSGRLNEHDRNDRNWREVFRFCLYVPAMHGICLVHLENRPNLEVSNLGVWVWDDTASLPPLFPYSYLNDSLPTLPADITDVVIDNKLQISYLASGETRLRYDDSSLLNFDLTFSGIVAEPIDHPNPKYSSLVQPMRATGRLAVPGCFVEVDDVAIVSRAWGTIRRSGATAFGASGMNDDMSFNLRCDSDSDGRVEFVEGFVHQDGTTAQVTSAQRTVIQNLDGYAFDIGLKVTDELGRKIDARGVVANTGELHTKPSLEVVTSLINWTVGEQELWGGDWASAPRTKRSDPNNHTLGLSAPAGSPGLHAGQRPNFKQSSADLVVLTREFCQSVEAGDFDHMEQLWEHTRRVLCIQPGMPIARGWDEVAASWRARLVDPVQIIPANLSVSIEGNLAWVAYDCDTVDNMAHNDMPAIRVATTTYSFANDAWLVIAHHGSDVPQPIYDNG